jgi:hypothetical protein
MTTLAAPVSALAEAAALVAAAGALAGLALVVRAWGQFRARRRRQVAPLSRRQPGGVNILPFPPRARVIHKRPW